MLDLLMFMAHRGLPENEEGDSERDEEKSATQGEEESPSFRRGKSQTKGHALAKGEENP